MLSRYFMYSTENNTDSKYSLLSPYLMYSTENNTDSKYSLLSPYLMYSTENNTDSKYSLLSLPTSCMVLTTTLIVSTPCSLPTSCTVLKMTLVVSTFDGNYVWTVHAYIFVQFSHDCTYTLTKFCSTVLIICLNLVCIAVFEITFRHRTIFQSFLRMSICYQLCPDIVLAQRKCLWL